MEALVKSALDHALAALAWWLDGLWIGLPETLRNRLFSRRERLVMRFANDEVSIERLAGAAGVSRDTAEIYRAACPLRGTAPEELASVPEPESPSFGEDAEITVVLPRQSRLTRVLTLPLSAETDLRSVLFHELERLTPFSMEQCAFDYTVIERDRQRACLAVRVALAYRSTLQRFCEFAASLGAQPTAVTVADEQGRILPLNLLTRGRRLRLPQPAFEFRPAIAGLAALALLAALYMPLERYDRLLRTQEQIVAAQRQQAVAARTAIDEAVATRAGAEYLQRRLAAYVRPIDALLVLSQSLPDHTWVTRLAISDTGVQFQGESNAAAELLETIESTQRFVGAEFQAPVARASNSGKEQFSVAAAYAEIQ